MNHPERGKILSTDYTENTERGGGRTRRFAPTRREISFDSREKITRGCNPLLNRGEKKKLDYVIATLNTVSLPASAGMTEGEMRTEGNHGGCPYKGKSGI